MSGKKTNIKGNEELQAVIDKEKAVKKELLENQSIVKNDNRGNN
jgi:hypothetical protein